MTDAAAHFAALRLGALFFKHLKCIVPGVVSDDTALFFKNRVPLLAGCSTYADNPAPCIKGKIFRIDSRLKATGELFCLSKGGHLSVNSPKYLIAGSLVNVFSAGLFTSQ